MLVAANPHPRLQPQNDSFKKCTSTERGASKFCTGTSSNELQSILSDCSNNSYSANQSVGQSRQMSAVSATSTSPTASRSSAAETAPAACRFRTDVSVCCILSSSSPLGRPRPRLAGGTPSASPPAGRFSVAAAAAEASGSAAPLGSSAASGSTSAFFAAGSSAPVAHASTPLSGQAPAVLT